MTTVHGGLNLRWCGFRGWFFLGSDKMPETVYGHSHWDSYYVYRLQHCLFEIIFSSRRVIKLLWINPATSMLPGCSRWKWRRGNAYEARVWSFRGYPETLITSKLKSRINPIFGSRREEVLEHQMLQHVLATRCDKSIGEVPASMTMRTTVPYKFLHR